jgi:arginyl-tRNA---protein transferase
MQVRFENMTESEGRSSRPEYYAGSTELTMNESDHDAGEASAAPCSVSCGTSSSRPANSLRLSQSGVHAAHCGYCHGARAVPPSHQSSLAYVAWSGHGWTGAAYQALLYHGWRRSGRTLYQPDHATTCCPCFPIRLPVQDFEATPSQRRDVNKLTSLLRGVGTAAEPRRPANSTPPPLAVPLLSQLQQATWQALHLVLAPNDHDLLPPAVNILFGPRNTSGKQHQQQSVYSTSIGARVAGQSRGKYDRAGLAQAVADALRRLPGVLSVQAHAPSGQVQVSVSSLNNAATNSNHHHAPPSPRQVKFADWWRHQRHGRSPNGDYALPDRLRVETWPAQTSACHAGVHQLYWDYQHEVHGDAHPLRGDLPTTPPYDHHDPVLLPSRIQAMLAQQYGHLPPERRRHLQRSYQLFHDFLVDNPFDDEDGWIEQTEPLCTVEITATTTNQGTAPTTALPAGTYHQHYRLGDQLVAVGVVDVLPTGLSSVYLFYQAYFARHFVPLGKFAIMQEIQWTQQYLQLPYYYLGYYIESCPKMRYKADYRPSQLLCPVTFQWMPLEQARRVMQQDDDSPPRRDGALYKSDDDDTAAASVFLHLGVDTLLTVDMLPASGQAVVRPLVREFARRAGPQACALVTIDFS